MPVYSSDRQILETARKWLDAGHAPALVTVAATWGSSPRQAGSLLVMREDGKYTGSVSGGCVEADLVRRYRDGELPAALPTLVSYGANRLEASRLGLPCGGRLELLVEALDGLAPVVKLLDKIQHKQLVCRRVCLSTGEVSLHPAGADETFRYSPHTISKVFGPEWVMLLIGAGQLSSHVARLALMLDYQVVICDPRRDYIEEEPLEPAERVYMMPDEAVQRYANHPRSVVLALTHDPKLDDMALPDALDSPAFYIGALGSRQTSEKRRERLGSLGVGREQLGRLHAPVGLDIGSHSPAEIAVSILAELTALRNRAAMKAQKVDVA